MVAETQPAQRCTKWKNIKASNYIIRCTRYSDSKKAYKVKILFALGLVTTVVKQILRILLLI